MRRIFTVRSPITVVDAAVYALIFLLGVLQFKYYIRAPDMVNDAMYVDLARSILEKGSYQFDFRPETLLPPGCSAILALVGLFLGFSPPVMYHTMAVSASLGLVASYELLRRTEGRMVAVPACLLLASSPVLFAFTTQLIFSDMPYFLAGTLVLLLALKMDRAQPGAARIGWMLLFGVSLVLTLMIRSSGIALLLGLVTWIAISLFTNPNLGRRRLRAFMIPMVLAFGAQLIWTEWAGQRKTPDWPIPGWPQSYVSQLMVKSGNHPELGFAGFRDIPARVEGNLTSHAAKLFEVLTRAWVNPFLGSPAVIGVIALIALGLSASLWKGGQLHDWYFFYYEVMYMLWPWNLETRFLLPVVPLACLYLWRGGKLLKNFSIERPRAAGLCFVLAGAALMFYSAEAVIQTKHLQPLLAACFWGFLTLTGCGMLGIRSLRKSPVFARALTSLGPVRSRLLLPMRAASILALAALVGYGAELQLDIGRRNANFDMTRGAFYPDIEAAQWIRSHEASGVVMARKQDLVFHYSQHRVEWFPPTSNPDMLMAGIRLRHVAFVVVVHRNESYWLPPDDVCFERALQAYGSAFHLLHHGPNNWIYQVEAAPDQKVLPANTHRG